MLKKSQGKAVGYLTLIFIVAYPFLWLYQKIGAVGYGAIFSIIFVGWLFLRAKKTSRSSAEFETDCLNTLYQRSAKKDTKHNRYHERVDARKAELIRHLQIFNDSIYLALNSKNPDTASLRMSATRETFQEICRYKDIQTDRLASAISRAYNEVERAYPETVCINVAKGLVEKSSTVKTERTKSKYIAEAINVLQTGLSGQPQDSQKIRGMLAELEAQRDGAPNHPLQARRP